MSSLSGDPAGRPRATVWYDGDCPLCAREIGLMRRLDRRGAIAFVDLWLDGDCPVRRKEMMERLHAREDGGRLVSGAEAFAVMWRAIPILRPLGLLARGGAPLWLLERAYRGFLAVRPALQALARAIWGLPSRAPAKGPGHDGSA
jgi:predicted DCC family thiol-disulfide oxidoreductase YuxK